MYPGSPEQSLPTVWVFGCCLLIWRRSGLTLWSISRRRSLFHYISLLARSQGKGASGGGRPPCVPPGGQPSSRDRRAEIGSGVERGHGRKTVGITPRYLRFPQRPAEFYARRRSGKAARKAAALLRPARLTRSAMREERGAEHPEPRPWHRCGSRVRLRALALRLHRTSSSSCVEVSQPMPPYLASIRGATERTAV